MNGQTFTQPAPRHASPHHRRRNSCVTRKCTTASHVSDFCVFCRRKSPSSNPRVQRVAQARRIQRESFESLPNGRQIAACRTGHPGKTRGYFIDYIVSYYYFLVDIIKIKTQAQIIILDIRAVVRPLTSGKPFDINIDQYSFPFRIRVFSALRPQMGQTALHSASLHGNVEALEALLDSNADVDVCNENGATPLHLAVIATNNASQCCSLLLDHGADPLIEDTHGRVPYELTDDTVLRLLLGGPSLELHEAARVGDLNEMRRLVDEGAELCARDASGRTPLHLAVETDQHAAMQLLLQLGASVSEQDDNGLSPLHYAVIHRRRRALVALLGGPGVDVNLVSATPGTGPPPCATALHLAVCNGDYEASEALLRAHADPNIPDGNGSRALHVALEADNIPLIELLLSSGANPGAPSNEYDSTNRTEALQAFLSAGA